MAAWVRGARENTAPSGHPPDPTSLSENCDAGMIMEDGFTILCAVESKTRSKDFAVHLGLALTYG
jgi:hypothetical protein